MKSCKNCYWHYNDEVCVHESLDEVAQHDTYEKENCLGWLRNDFEEHFYNTYKEVLELLQKCNCVEMKAILEFIKSQRGENDESKKG